MRFELAGGSVLSWTHTRRWELDGQVLGHWPRFGDAHPDVRG